MKLLRTLSVMTVAMAFAFPAVADRVLNADVVVVGAGASGTVAAASAQEAGLKTVLLEKNAFAGGAGNFMEGSFAVESFMQKKAGVKLTKLEEFNRMGEYHHWRINAPLVKRFIDESPETIQWVWDHGVHWKEVKSVWAGNKNLTWHIYPKAGSLPAAMVQTFEKHGGRLLLQTPGKKLLMKDGRAVGVEAEDLKTHEKVTVNAKYVLLATGGYNFNPKLVKEFTGQDLVPSGAPGRTGDGIEMAFSAGAVGDNMGPMMINGAFNPLPGEAICNGPNKELRAIFRQSQLYLDGAGNRFFNEQLTLDWPVASNAILRAGEWTYILFDNAFVKELGTKGKGYLNPCGNFIQRHQVAKELPQMIQNGVKRGDVFEGATLEEVAKKAGLNPSNVKRAAADMTKFAKSGKDTQFGKDRYYIRAVSQGPYYILKGKLHTLTSLNGVKVTENLQVVDKNEKVIPGLYALGHDAGGVYGDSYDLRVGEGTASSFAINSARIAVKNILSQEKKL
ncbi:MAG: FAD-dependent oxidoreductase [Mesosutterella sp.]|uniref:FAD-dependent oxidoreductase n=1 Tax=Mesosutterella faecium TaxID=2925194 RepID=A0ABT7IR47_9BURK|nr:FAD-dependent oxidoreductase [Mesosutterella sp. AGMB02718]MCI6529912.1 FAD-dependent oxidoreductase [Mesosutterella sp.]MDL2060450.1 FAD-dependent oxidoreductase [Mesosutterella sp. AGMB02718]